MGFVVVLGGGVLIQKPRNPNLGLKLGWKLDWVEFGLNEVGLRLGCHNI